MRKMAWIGLTIIKIEDFIDPPPKSNMAAIMLDRDQLRNLISPTSDIHIYEI